MNSKLTLLLSLLTLFSFWDTGNSLNYNPFDPDCKISAATLLNNDCILLHQPCGYKTYGKEVDGQLIYYQFSPNEENEVVAKGICIHIDSTIITSNLFSKINQQVALVLSQPVDSSMIINPLINFGVQQVPNTQAADEFLIHAKQEEILTGINYKERLWCFKDKNGKIYTEFIHHKLGQNVNGERIIIRTLELFISY